MRAGGGIDLSFCLRQIPYKAVPCRETAVTEEGIDGRGLHVGITKIKKKRDGINQTEKQMDISSAAAVFLRRFNEDHS